ncbi:MAG: hypothetical protein HY692_05035 [Cyanobacteria bacterium NC_groundwater_1444_Ag_S-0.65um_54_12]|nr:hypothetical protein [Cyanobacteria bacterium NC_groundwater_1444_Ag_S-0.65um_54_12]
MRSIENIGAWLLVMLAGITGCSMQELILRRSAVDWGHLGIKELVVIPATPSTEVSGDRTLAAQGTAMIFASANETELSAMTATAAELLTFALRESAVVVKPNEFEQPRLEVTVKEAVAVSKSATAITAPLAKREFGTLPYVRQELGSQPNQEIQFRAVVEARLIVPATSQTLWHKEAVGMVELPQTSNFTWSNREPDTVTPESKTSEETLGFFQEVAVRRALGQLTDELLPRYEYRDLR